MIAGILMVLNRSNFVFNFRSIYSLGIYPIQNATKNISKAFVYIYTSVKDIFTLQSQIQVLRDRKRKIKGIIKRSPYL